MPKFSNAKIGDRVWSSIYGWGEINDIYDGSILKVIFTDESKTVETYFTVDGKHNIGDKYPTLFWNEFHIPIEEDKKSFDLVEYLKENLVPKKFVCGEYNYYYYYDSKFKTWSTDYDEICQDIKTYFDDDDDDYLVDMLNQNQITPQQLKNAFKELRWL